MDGLFWLAAIVAIILVVMWCVINDKRAEGERTIGFFAMKEDTEQSSDK